MRRVIYEDRNGFLRAAMIREEDPDEAAPTGIPLEPPELSDLDCEEIRRDIHNALVREGLFTWEDVQKGQNLLLGLIDRAIRRKLVQRFRIKEQEARAQ